MKAILEPTDCKVFQPITITVTLETIEEAHELWHRLNICQDHIDRDYQLEWGLEFPALGPFMRGENALIPFSDSINLLKENKVRVNFNSSKLNWLMNPLINFNHRFYCRFFAFIFPSSEIQFELKVIK